jgi:circadian clock protein KaiB
MMSATIDFYRPNDGTLSTARDWRHLRVGPNASYFTISLDFRTAKAREKQMSDETGPGAGNKFRLKLYVTGQTANSRRAIANLREICERAFSGEYELMVIDVLENPQLAEEEKILATPTLVRSLPPPMRRVIGDLSDKERVLLGLDLIAKNDS